MTLCYLKLILYFVSASHHTGGTGGPGQEMVVGSWCFKYWKCSKWWVIHAVASCTLKTECADETYEKLATLIVGSYYVTRASENVKQVIVDDVKETRDKLGIFTYIFFAKI